MSTWQRFERMLEKHAPDLLLSFRPSATPAQIETIEHLLGIALPADVRRAYLRHDGCLTDNWRPRGPRTPCLFSGAYWCSLDKMIERWQMMTTSLENFKAEQASDVTYPYPPMEPEQATDWAEREVRAEWWNPRWIPLGLTNTATTIWCDLVPAPKGRIGQLLSDFGECEPGVFAPSLDDFLEIVIGCAESGLVRFDRSLRRWTTVHEDKPPGSRKIDRLPREEQRVLEFMTE